MIVALFFGAAVLSMGGMYSLVPSLLERPSIVLLGAVALLGISLGFSLIVVGRTFWVLSRGSYSRKST